MWDQHKNKSQLGFNLSLTLASDAVLLEFNNVGSLSVNVSATTGTGRSEYVNAGELGASISLRDGLKLTKTGFLAFLVHLTLIYCFGFL